MYELIQAGKRTYYIDCPVKMGIYVHEDDSVTLIDSGNDKEAGRKLLKIIGENGWTLRCIVNTHSNADHIGGNAFLQSKTGCKAFSNGVEKAFIEYPELETAFLYGGYPMKDLRNKFLMAKESAPTDISHEDFPKELEVLPLGGHFFHMIGIRTPDEVVFLADALFSEEIIQKYHIFFMYDVEAFFQTLQRIETMKAALFIPSHAPVTDNPLPLIEINRKKVLEILHLLEGWCLEPLSFDQILKKVFDHYHLIMDFNQYVLVGSSIRSYLSYMKNQGILSGVFQDNVLLWQKS